MGSFPSLLEMGGRVRFSNRWEVRKKSVEFQPHEKWEPSHRLMEKYVSSRELGSLVALVLHLALAFTSRFIRAKIKAAPFYMKSCWLVTSSLDERDARFMP